MESYKSYCPDCKKTYFWIGYKTGIGKSSEQLSAMEKQETVCKYCGSNNLKTGFDMETDIGNDIQEGYNIVASLLVDAMSKTPIVK